MTAPTTAPPNQSNTDRLIALTNAQAASQNAAAATVTAYLLLQLRNLQPSMYDDAAVRRFSTQAASLVGAGRSNVGAATQAYTNQILGELGGTQLSTPATLSTQPRGVDAYTEWSRLAKMYRYLISTGVDEETAFDQTLTRAQLMAEQDINLAMRDVAAQVFDNAPEVIGYRRVLHPELSAGGSCGLCVVAADRVYRKAELMPLHERCECKPMPVLAEDDPGRFINDLDLQAIYDASGGTDARQLKTIRYVVHEHSELGPVLRRAGDHFRDADDIVATE